jgi:hypothetical protein
MFQPFRSRSWQRQLSPMRNLLLLRPRAERVHLMKQKMQLPVPKAPAVPKPLVPESLRTDLSVPAFWALKEQTRRRIRAAKH